MAGSTDKMSEVPRLTTCQSNLDLSPAHAHKLRAQKTKENSLGPLPESVLCMVQYLSCEIQDRKEDLLTQKVPGSLC